MNPWPHRGAPSRGTGSRRAPFRGRPPLVLRAIAVVAAVVLAAVVAGVALGVALALGPRGLDGSFGENSRLPARAIDLAARASEDLLSGPSIASSASGPVTVGATVTDTAVLTGGSGPTGTITFQLFGLADPTCSAPPVFATTSAVHGDGAYRSAPVAPARPGLYQWVAMYGGDAANGGQATACNAVGSTSVVVESVPRLGAIAPPSLSLGASLRDTAVLAGGSKPTGSLMVTVFGPDDATCAGSPAFRFPPLVVAGAGTYTTGPFTPSVPGTYRFEVQYSGDADNLASTTRCGTTSQVTAVAPGTVVITGQPPPPAVLGGTIVSHGVIAGGTTPTGTITFTVYGPNDALCSGLPAFASPPVAVTGDGTYRSPPFTPSASGSYSIVISYSGDRNNAAALTPCAATDEAVSVSRAIPTIAAETALQVFAGAPVTAAETVSAGVHPTGSIGFTFYAPTDPSCTETPVFISPPQRVHGNGTYGAMPFTPLVPGDYRFVAAYSGDQDNIAVTTNCNATNQALLVSASGIYVPADHPRPVIKLEVVAFALLTVAGSAGAKNAGLSPGPTASRPANAPRPARMEGSVVASGLDNTAEGWTAVTVDEAAEEDEENERNRGDASRTWHWPGTSRIDRLSSKVPKRVAPASPMAARITNDAGYLRAMFGSASALLPLAGVALAAVAVHDVHGHALPPPFVIAMAIAVLGVLDAFAGLVAVAVFVVGIFALGGLSTANDVRTVIGLASLWFVTPIVAGVARPLRREPTRSTSEHVERGADVVVGAFVGAWAVREIIQGLPGLSGMVLPIAAHATAAALIVLAALGLRMVVETIAAHHYPRRLAKVQEEELPVSGTAQHGAAAAVAVAVFFLVALPYVGPSWELYLGGVFFAIPSVLKLCANHIPNVPKLYAVIPRGILQAVTMLVVGTAFGALVATQLQHQSNQEVIRESFVLLSLPGLALAVLQVFGREGPDAPKLHWLPEKLLGAAVLALGVLFVFGVITI